MPLLSMCVFTDIILIMKNRHHHPRRSFLRDGKQHKSFGSILLFAAKRANPSASRSAVRRGWFCSFFLQRS